MPPLCTSEHHILDAKILFLLAVPSSRQRCHLASYTPSHITKALTETSWAKHRLQGREKADLDQADKPSLLGWRRPDHQSGPAPQGPTPFGPPAAWQPWVTSAALCRVEPASTPFLNVILSHRILVSCTTTQHRCHYAGTRCSAGSFASEQKWQLVTCTRRRVTRDQNSLICSSYLLSPGGALPPSPSAFSGDWRANPDSKGLCSRGSLLATAAF